MNGGLSEQSKGRSMERPFFYARVARGMLAVVTTAGIGVPYGMIILAMSVMLAIVVPLILGFFHAGWWAIAMGAMIFVLGFRMHFMQHLAAMTEPAAKRKFKESIPRILLPLTVPAALLGFAGWLAGTTLSRVHF